LRGSVKYFGRFGGQEYQNQSAEEKRNILWNQVLQDPNGAQFSTWKLVELLAEPMSPSFDSYRDDFTGMEGPFGYFNRSKFVHTVGAVGLVVYNSVGNHPYTGIFRGSKYALARLSTPTSYDSTARSFVASVAFKFLRDGVPSGNIFGICSLEGRYSYNFFRHDLYSNPVFPSLNESFALQVVQRKFMEASDWGMIGTSYLATFDEQGNKEQNPVFPFNMVFQGSKQAKALFTDSFVSSDLPVLLSKIPAGTLLYNVWAEEPNQQPLKIGEITLQTALTSSDFGDNGLFFQHTRKEDDFQLRPDWVSYANNLVQEQGSKYYYNGPPDLPL